MTVKTDSYILGINPDDTRNFLLDTDGAGALRIRRRADGSGGLLATFDAAGNLQLGASTNANAGRMVLATAQNATSGTAIDFTAIPSWAKRITVMFNGVSTNGTGHWLVQVGNGSFVNSGYASGAVGQVNGQVASVASSSAGFIVFNDLATDTRSGVLTISLMTGTTYVSSHSLMTVNGAGTSLRSVSWAGSGISGSSGAAIDRIRLTTVNGTDTFDAGFVNLMYEG